MTTSELLSFKQKTLQWANSFDVCCYLNSNGYSDPYGDYDLLIAAGARAGAEKTLEASAGNAFKKLDLFYKEHQNWMFGLLGYDLKNEVEDLSSANADVLGFPDLFFFVPEYLIGIKGDTIEILLGDPGILEIIQQVSPMPATAPPQQELLIQQRTSKESYIQKVEELRQHINRGDCYEITFCQEFFAEHAVLDPLAVYLELNAVSPTPFSGFFKIHDRYILSASPERFLRKKGNTLISQPIKGTAKRGASPLEDEQIKVSLRDNAKEQAENVMIVDLVRNDLTKSAVPGTVKVEELFGIYSFAQVHQMISTVSCELNPEISCVEAIKNAFPMGSMTGAPKVKAMKLIEEYEGTKRGAYSGSMGYINPAGDFDFNVIIRSILYNSTKEYLSFQVGGAITYASNADNEYEECILKASAIVKTLKGPN